MIFDHQDKNYVSGIDRLLQEYDATHSKSESQRYEIAKYRRIHYLRDHVKSKSTHTNNLPIWKDF